MYVKLNPTKLILLKIVRGLFLINLTVAIIVPIIDIIIPKQSGVKIKKSEIKVQLIPVYLKKRRNKYIINPNDRVNERIKN